MTLPARRLILLALHLAGAVVVALWMVERYQQREAAVDALAQRERSESAACEEQRHQLSVQQARLEGIDRQEPYVVELIAREKFGFRSPGEIAPPPMPDSD
jgi:hypothetical protein